MRMNLAISWATSNCDLPVTSTSILSAISLSASCNWKAAVHSRTSYSKATPSGSFSSNHFSAASTSAKTLMCSGSPTCLLVLTYTKTVIGLSSACACPNDDFCARDQRPVRRDVQRPHDADPGQHRGPAFLCNEN